jgi:PAS domain S-box-containing protein
MSAAEPITTVLVVDDEDATRYVVGRMLKKAGLNVLEAACGADALRLAKTHPDIILLDVNLPDMDGYAVCRALKADPETTLIPVVHLSASYVQSEDRALGLNHGAEGYLTHPVEDIILVATINALIRFRRAEDALRVSEAKNRLLISVVPGVIFTADAAGQWDYVNPTWTTHTGMTSTVASGAGWLSGVHPDDHGSVSRWWSGAVADGVATEREFRVGSVHSGWRWFLCRVAANDEAGCVPRRWVGSLTDIDQLKGVEDALTQTARAKDQFLAALSHELRTPLTPVLATAESMASDPALSPETREQAALIARNVELEVRLIDDLLDINHIIKGKLQLHARPTDVHESLRQVLDICAADLLSKRLRVTRDLAAGSCIVDADPARLQQVLWNIIKNAVKFTPAGGSIAINTRDDADGLLSLTVTDDGIGIPSNVLPLIFDAFQQGGANTSFQFGGLGLGLTISKAIVDLHGGTLAVRSDGPGTGATFSIRMPRSKSRFVAEPDLPAPHDRATCEQPSSVLLVEDHVDTAKVMCQFLQRWGYSVKTVTNCADALVADLNNDFDLIISDIGLPDGSGMALLQDLLKRRPVRAIALSGFGMDDDVAKSKEAGFLEHLTKPINLSRLRATVARVLNDTEKTVAHGGAGDKPLVE